MWRMSMRAANQPKRNTAGKKASHQSGTFIAASRAKAASGDHGAG